MTQIKNNTDRALDVGPRHIAAGAIVEFDDWDIIKEGDIAKGLLDAGAIMEYVADSYHEDAKAAEEKAEKAAEKAEFRGNKKEDK